MNSFMNTMETEVLKILFTLLKKDIKLLKANQFPPNLRESERMSALFLISSDLLEEFMSVLGVWLLISID
jgi:hypothetical protein